MEMSELIADNVVLSGFGRNSMIFNKSSNELFVSGDNKYGQLGLGKTTFLVFGKTTFLFSFFKFIKFKINSYLCIIFTKFIILKVHFLICLLGSIDKKINWVKCTNPK